MKKQPLSKMDLMIRRLKRGWASGLDIVQEVGSMKLTSRITDIRRMGYEVADKWSEGRAYKLYRITRSPAA
jgi:hypothetical protein